MTAVHHAGRSGLNSRALRWVERSIRNSISRARLLAAACSQDNEAACAAANRVPAASGSNSRSYATVAQCDNSSSWACEGSPSGVTYTAPASAGLFYFDAFGKPYSGAAAAGTMTVTVTDANNVRSVVVESETGYVH